MAKECPQDCVYIRRFASGNTEYCAYWAIANELRGCEPGKGCKRYVGQKNKNPHRKATWDTKAGRAMFEQGKTCSEISKALGVDYDKVWACVRRWKEK